jgi:hypothetical protein
LALEAVGSLIELVIASVEALVNLSKRLFGTEKRGS